MAELVIELTGSKSSIGQKKLPEDDPRKRKPNTALAERLLGWKPEVALRDGLISTIKFFKHRVEH